jgi:hypothetical protein
MRGNIDFVNSFMSCPTYIRVNQGRRRGKGRGRGVRTFTTKESPPGAHDTVCENEGSSSILDMSIDRSTRGKRREEKGEDVLEKLLYEIARSGHRVFLFFRWRCCLARCLWLRLRLLLLFRERVHLRRNSLALHVDILSRCIGARKRWWWWWREGV